MGKLILIALSILLILFVNLNFVSAYSYNSNSLFYYSNNYKNSRPVFMGANAEVYQIKRSPDYYNYYISNYPGSRASYGYFSGGPYFSGGYYRGFYGGYMGYGNYYGYGMMGGYYW